MFGIVIAFKNYNFADGLLHSPWSGFENFKYLFQTNDAWIITRNTLGYNLEFIFLNLVLSLVIAIVLSELNNKFIGKFYQSIMFLPYFLSWVVVAYLVYAILAPEGLYNKSIAPALHMHTIDFYNEEKYWPFIFPIVNIWKGIGYGVVIYLAGISGIDQEYYEAATLDGASKYRQVTNITIPFLKPMMIVTTIIGLGYIFRSDFGLFFQLPMNSGLIYNTTAVLDTYIYGVLMNSTDLGMSSAAGLYQSMVGLMFVLSANWIIGKISPENKIF
ncbi:ABC transporter permease subunit [Cohnella yongneupensis]|uniref:ABC transporter permease subunit n=1 Tax=Cohnella yongneupensis TaxID=425006 RepID=A0ABW0R2K9_9BACL